MAAVAVVRLLRRAASIPSSVEPPGPPSGGPTGPTFCPRTLRAVTLDDLRRYAVRRTFFGPTSLQHALNVFGFVQADPIRAPARAQDLTLRHRVAAYRAGDLERRYAELDVHEDFFINYGFVTSAVHRLMHPRKGRAPWSVASGRRVSALLDFVRARGTVHPREVDAQFAHGTVTNYWGGSSNATTHLLDQMHYRGLLRVARRERGIRVYAAHEPQSAPRDRTARRARVDALVDVIVRAYAPLPSSSLSMTVRRLRFAVPQWQGELAAALGRARQRLASARVEGVEWFWPREEAVDLAGGSDDPAAGLPRSAVGPGIAAGSRQQTLASDDTVRFLAPFDPLVWDRRRFEMLWGWAYRFEAYTPVAKRKLGYYALPLLWRDRVIGWGNLSIEKGTLRAEFGYASAAPPRDRAYRRALEDELQRMREFLGSAG